jgi:hypothetical protein
MYVWIHIYTIYLEIVVVFGESIHFSAQHTLLPLELYTQSI